MKIQPSDLQRVAVVGTSCSGKTTFADSLSVILGIPHIELDALYWLPGWVERPTAEFCTLVEKETSSNRWVSDGNYSNVRDIVWGRATDVVWLNYSFPLVFSRALRRSICRALTIEELFSGNRESIRKTFFSSDSILVWIIKSYRRNRVKYRAFKNSPQWKHLQFWEFKRPSEAADFLSLCKDTVD
ncbi:hypothetical protein ACFLXB_09875 [Chloroflexota bacterium]